MNSLHPSSSATSASSIRWWPYLMAVGVCVPWLTLATQPSHPAAAITALLAGVAILGGAFLLSWGCEVAEMDMPQALAVSLLALIAVLPEYAVDASFAWNAATDPTQAPYAIANMTGGNRLLLGIGWPIIVFGAWLKSRAKAIHLPKQMGADFTILFLATIYSAVPIMRGELALIDTAVYAVMYVVYLIAASAADGHDVEPVGPAALVAAFPKSKRIATVAAMFVFAAGAIFISAEPFAEALVATGTQFGVDEFLLVQWVAPFASEAPEVVVALLLVSRGLSSTGMRALVSSKVNQWTLLVGTLPVVYSLAKGAPGALHMDERQQTEMMLTAAQSLFGLAVIADRSLSIGQAALLVILFIMQVSLPDFHHEAAYVYIALFFGIMIFQKESRKGLIDGFYQFYRMLRRQAS